MDSQTNFFIVNYQVDLDNFIQGISFSLLERNMRNNSINVRDFFFSFVEKKFY